MMHTAEERRDHDIQVDRSNPNTYYDRDRCEPDPDYVDDDLEDALRLLNSERRRITIQRLAELENERTGRLTIGLEQLAREVAAIEDDVEPDVVNWRSLRSAKTGLRNNHLPLLDRLGIVEWDAERRVVTTTAGTDHSAALLERVLQAVQESPLEQLDTRRWSRW